MGKIDFCDENCKWYYRVVWDFYYHLALCSPLPCIRKRGWWHIFEFGNKTLKKSRGGMGGTGGDGRHGGTGTDLIYKHLKI